jgi:hypothetical protein
MQQRYELRILGAPDLRAPDGRRVGSVLSQPSRLSLLSYLALAPGPVSRAALVARFWPESDETHARNALSQAVFHLRRSLGKDVVQSVEGDRLWVPPESLWCDARALLAEREPPKDVVAAADAELLAGWNADGSQPLQEWLDAQRRRVRERVEKLRTRNAAAAAPATEKARDVAPSPPRQRRTWLPFSVAAGIAAVVLVAVLPSLGPGPDSDGAVAATAPDRLVVLLPRVTPSPGAPEISALTLNAEIIARLPERPGLEVRSAPFAGSIQELTSQRATLGGAPDDFPEWILEVGVTVTSERVHVFALLYQGDGLRVLGRDSFDEEFHDPSEIIIQVPHAIADEVARMVEGVL